MSICTAPIYKLRELNNIFIEMTSQNCNQKCESCYKKAGLSKNVKDFITIDKIKEALYDTKENNIYCIYLTGSEPMMHPDFNAILRLCLKRSNVCICTNSSFLNEKKIRFLKKVEDEGVNQIFFKLTLVHFNELENDKSRYRGNFRQTISALKILCRYNFTSVLSVQNVYNLQKEEIRENFLNIFKMSDITDTDIQINVSYPVKDDLYYTKSAAKTDCMTGRSISQSGVYSCPFLSGDYRGRMGASFKDYSQTVNAETDFCAVCSANENCVFGIG